MFALLNPRIWIALALVAGLALTHFTAYRKGKANVRQEWLAATAQANIESAKITQDRQSVADEAARLAATRADRNRVDAAHARAVANGLRGELDATRLYAAQSLDAATKSVAALSLVFEQCSRSHQELAEVADRHASDALNLQQAWPK